MNLAELPDELDRAAAITQAEAEEGIAAARRAYTVAALPLAPPEGATAYATNGRKSGEGAGAGTGVPVYYSAGKWRVYRDDSEVQA